MTLVKESFNPRDVATHRLRTTGLVKYLVQQHQDLSSISRSHIKKPFVAAQAVTPELGGWRHMDLGSLLARRHNPVSELQTP